jgi:hypothetical protein
MRAYRNVDYFRNQLRSSPPTHEQVLEEFVKILKKHRRAVLKANRDGIRAFGEELAEFGGLWAIEVGRWTVPMQRFSFDPDPRVIWDMVYEEWKETTWSQQRAWRAKLAARKGGSVESCERTSSEVAGNVGNGMRRRRAKYGRSSSAT